MRGNRVIVPILLLAILAAYWWLRPASRKLPEAYIGERSATLWSSMAQVREPVAMLHYGEKVEVLERTGERVEVRTAPGLKGWLETPQLIDPELWLRSAELLAHTLGIPVQGRGSIKVISNVHFEPGRTRPRIYQFGRGTPVEIISKAVAEMPASAEDRPGKQREAHREDWYLVRGFTSALAAGESGGATGKAEETSIVAGLSKQGTAGKSKEPIEVAGWVLARFVELDLPDPIREYASAAGMRVVAWFELNRVGDREGERPQYLVAGVHGGEGQPCDFTMIRVYTWGHGKQRYETAYRESNLCGRLPVRVTKTAAGDAEFRFAAVGKSGDEEHLYRMRQTIVRRVRESKQALARR